MSNQRFIYDGPNRYEFEQLLVSFKLNEPPKRTDALQPEISTEEMANDFLKAYLYSRNGGPPLGLLKVGELLQRITWMDAEIKGLRRTNRNLRSKNKRLDKLRQTKTQTDGK